MSVEALFTDMLPLGAGPRNQTVRNCFMNQMRQADRVEIVVSRVSQASLEKLDELLTLSENVKHLGLVMGMYGRDEIPEKAFYLARALNEKWQAAGRGEIRVSTGLQHHENLYCFYKEGIPFSIINTSADLSMLKPDAQTRRQYDVGILITDDPDALEEGAAHIERCESDAGSVNLSQAKKLRLKRERNWALDGVEFVQKLAPSDVVLYKTGCSDISFLLPLKVPAADERFMDDGQHYTQSNINFCYAEPRSGEKSRNWFETRFIPAADIRRLPDYPGNDHPFFVATDDGYRFKAHITGANNGLFSAVGDELLMGRWLKGRLAAAGLVEPVMEPQKDVLRTGMITKEMLDTYGCSVLTLSKTDRTTHDTDGKMLDVWYLSFDPAENAKT